MRLPDIRQNKGGTADTPPFAFPEPGLAKGFLFSGKQGLSAGSHFSVINQTVNESINKNINRPINKTTNPNKLVTIITKITKTNYKN